MNKIALEKKLVSFQERIVNLSQALTAKEKHFLDEKQALHSELMDIIDAFENIFNTIQNQEDQFDKTVKRAINSFRSIHRKLIRTLEAQGVQKIDLKDGKAQPGLCQVLETRVDAGQEEGTILSIVRQGYRAGDRILRPAEVITVSNPHACTDGK